MHRIVRAPLVALLFAALTAHPAPGAAAVAALTGEMSAFNALLGPAWNCTTSLPAMGAMPAHTEQLTVTFDVAPGNVLHDAISGEHYRGDDYFGYSSRFNNYWSASADSHAVHGFATSNDGKTYTGTSWFGPRTMQVTTTYTKAGPNRTAMRQVLSGDGEEMTIASACAR